MRHGPWALNVTINGKPDAVATYTNMPAAASFLFNSHRHVLLIDTEGMSVVRLKVNKQATAATTGAKLILRYSPVFSTNVSDYADIGETEVSVPIDTANQYLDSGWVVLSPNVNQEDIFLAIIGVGGNGVLDPQFGHISVAFA